MGRVDSLEKTDAGRDWGQEEKGTTGDEMAVWHHRLNGREFGWTPRVGDGQEGLVCCDSWDRKESDTTEWLNWTELNWTELNWRYHARYRDEYITFQKRKAYNLKITKNCDYILIFKPQKFFQKWHLQVKIHVQVCNVHTLRIQTLTRDSLLLKFLTRQSTYQRLWVWPWETQQAYVPWYKHLNAFICILLMC